MTTEVVKFNIGGQRYEVSRSLLQMYPDSMLAKSASDQWQEDPEAEIFIEGDGALFQYILQYLRHGSVSLPITVSKNALLKELEYYGINVDENTIDDSAMHKAKSFQSVRVAAEDLKQTIATLKMESDRTETDYRCAQLALDCIKHYSQKAVTYQRHLTIDVSCDIKKDVYGALKNIQALRSLVKGDDEKARKGANVHLNAVGLNLSAYQTAHGYLCSDSSGKSVSGYYCYHATLEEIDVVQTEE